MREFAVGKLLGVGHIALSVYAVLTAFPHFGWGSQVLTWGYRLAVQSGHPVTGAMAASWADNRVIQYGYTALSHLPWGLAAGTYFVLAVACLVVRLARPLPGWLSLVVALPAAVYGLLVAVADFPLLAIYWPLSAMALVVAWIVVGKTVRQY
jgi:hypothetical protein